MVGLGTRVSQDMEDYFVQKNSQMQVDCPDKNTTYVGWAEKQYNTSEPKWRIKRILIVGTVTEIQYAGGRLNFTNIWDDRATLTYSYT